MATVSKALNDHSDISEETRRKVKEAANRLGYYPNSAARALKTNRSYNIGVLLNNGLGNMSISPRFLRVLRMKQRRRDMILHL
ncbi:MAG: LacI family DNA-binding transcriptional regulator [Lachnospira eligens]